MKPHVNELFAFIWKIGYCSRIVKSSQFYRIMIDIKHVSMDMYLGQVQEIS